MPFKSSETRPQQGRGQTIKTKCPLCGTYIQSVYMKINGKLVSIGEECPNCIEEKRKNELNKEELDAILAVLNAFDPDAQPIWDVRAYELLEGIHAKLENRLKYN
jgi:DNA repair exonuclease SbcCD ATPase subunit